MAKATTAATAEQLQEIVQYISDNIKIPTIGVGGGFAPIGAVEFFDAITAPQDWLVCDGTVYNIADYPQLAQHYAVNHGTANFYGGDGVTTFAVPNWQGEFFRASGTNSHTNQGSGAAVGAHQDATEIPRIGLHYDSCNNKYGIVGDVGNSGNNYATKSDSYITTSTRKYIEYDGVAIQTGSESGNYKYTSRPTSTSLLCCVKAIDAGEVYSTTERKVGTWIDGKPIYQKTVDCGYFLNGNDTKKVAVDGQSVMNVVHIFGVGIDSNGNSFPLDKAHDQNVNYQIAVDFGRSNGIALASRGGDYSSYRAYVTLRYTKTTD